MFNCNCQQDCKKRTLLIFATNWTNTGIRRISLWSILSTNFLKPDFQLWHSPFFLGPYLTAKASFSKIKKSRCITILCRIFKCDIGSISSSTSLFYDVMAFSIPILVFSGKTLRRGVHIGVANPIFDRNRFQNDCRGSSGLILTSGRIGVQSITTQKYENNWIIQKYHFKNKFKF